MDAPLIDRPGTRARALSSPSGERWCAPSDGCRAGRAGQGQTQRLRQPAQGCLGPAEGQTGHLRHFEARPCNIALPPGGLGAEGPEGLWPQDADLVRAERELHRVLALPRPADASGPWRFPRSLRPAAAPGDRDRPIGFGSFPPPPRTGVIRAPLGAAGWYGLGVPERVVVIVMEGKDT